MTLDPLRADDWLDEAALTRLTGKKANPARRRVLDAAGIDYKVRPNGSLIVSRRWADPVPSSATVEGPQPDFSVFS